MRHYPLSDIRSAHYAANVNCLEDSVLVQIQDDFGIQVRIGLTKEQAKHFVELINESIEAINYKNLKEKLKEE